MTGIVVLSGGVGGARFLRGLVEVVPPSQVTVIGNVGDDLELLGLHVSPDLDSILYTLAGEHDDARGWGRRDETWNALETVARLGGDAWFQLGDRDIGLHLVRTQALRAGQPLSAVTRRVAAGFGLELDLLPATDDRLRTYVETAAGTFPLQEWFVRRRHADAVDGVLFDGAAEARPAPGVIEAIDAASVLLLAPSNPYISLWPILAVRELRAAVERSGAPVVGVSPLIGGRAVKGPADAMLRRLAGGTAPVHVAGCYEGLLDALVIDEADRAGAAALAAAGVRPVVAQTLMSDDAARARLAEAALDAAHATTR
jgi:LPPG:FO 2-phospho-L-lactate transferase